MKKEENQYKTYINLSKNESDLLNSINGNIVFSTALIRKKTGWETYKIKNTLASLKRKGFIILIKKNNYVIKNKVPENKFHIVNNLINPSYISFWTVFSFYGCTEQQVKAIQVISTKQFRNINIANFRIETTTFKSKEFFGYTRINNFVIAEKEKLIIDSLYKPEKIGGIDELKKGNHYYPENFEDLIQGINLYDKNYTGHVMMEKRQNM